LDIEPILKNLVKVKMMLKKALNVKLFADGADKQGMAEMYKNELISGFTTNPTLMRKAGVTDYKGFAHEIIRLIPDRSISFEVFSDDFNEMYKQALEISSWGSNVYAKIPVMNTKGESSIPLIKKLAAANVKQNVTALMTLDQVREVTKALADGPSAYVSVFAGRIADTGCDPMPIMEASVAILKPHAQLELIWASTREVFNIFQADKIGCHIITVPNDMLNKLADVVGKDLEEYSLDTVKMFYRDGVGAGFCL
jgi:transaldolase